MVGWDDDWPMPDPGSPTPEGNEPSAAEPQQSAAEPEPDASGSAQVASGPGQVGSGDGRPARQQPELSSRSGLPNVPASLLRAALPYKRAATATTTLPDRQVLVTGWRPDARRLAEYRRLVGSDARMPLGFPQLAATALHLDLIASRSFPVPALGLVHPGFTVEVLAPLPAGEPWDIRAWLTGARHVRSGLEFDLRAEVIVGGTVRWRSTAVTLSKGKAASGSEESGAPQFDEDWQWESDLDFPVAEGTGRAFGRLSGDVNLIHLHALPARLFGFRQPIAHGWWLLGRIGAALSRDEATPGRVAEVGFRRPVPMPSTSQLHYCVDSAGTVHFDLAGEKSLVRGRFTR